MGNFPVLVHAGATLNVVLTVGATWLVCSHFERALLALPLWIALVLTLNLMPVVALRAVRWRYGEPMPLVTTMNFFGDQHRFADWVYVAASANMAFWITLSWCACVLRPAAATLAGILILALVSTFAPVLLRVWGSQGGRLVGEPSSHRSD